MKASFNWRLLFKIKTDLYTDFNKFSFTLQIKDKDVVSSDDYLSQFTISAKDIKELIDECILTGRSAKYNPEKSDRSSSDGTFTVETQKSLNREHTQNSKLKLSIEILTEEEAKIRPVGLGRGNPNQDPFLPEPIGRFEFSWNPIKLLVEISS